MTLKHPIFQDTCQIPSVFAVTRIEIEKSGGEWINFLGESHGCPEFIGSLLMLSTGIVTPLSSCNQIHQYVENTAIRSGGYWVLICRLI